MRTQQDSTSDRRRRAGVGAARFVLLFGLFMVIGHFALRSTAGEAAFVGPWTRANTTLAVGLASATGLDARSEGTLITSGDARLDVRKGCDGTGALLILVAAVLGFPATWRSRIVGLLTGAVAVFLINAVRLTTLVAIALHWPARLDYFHVDVWQPAMVLVTFGLFLLWGLFLARKPPAAAVPESQ